MLGRKKKERKERDDKEMLYIYKEEKEERTKGEKREGKRKHKIKKGGIYYFSPEKLAHWLKKRAGQKWQRKKITFFSIKLLWLQ